MPDIAMCMNHSCPKSKECYRHEAKPNVYRQSYADFKPNEAGVCMYFSPDNRTDKEKELDDSRYEKDLADYRSKYPMLSPEFK
jgi:hypothetical protein